MAFGSSLRDLGESAVHLKPPHGGFGDEWDSNAPGVERGLAIMCTKTSIYFCFTLIFLACSQKPFLALFLFIIPLTPQTIFTMFTNFLMTIILPLNYHYQPHPKLQVTLYDTVAQVYKERGAALLKPLYYWIHQIRLYYTYNPAPLTRIKQST